MQGVGGGKRRNVCKSYTRGINVAATPANRGLVIRWSGFLCPFSPPPPIKTSILLRAEIILLPTILVIEIIARARAIKLSFSTFRFNGPGYLDLSKVFTPFS